MEKMGLFSTIPKLIKATQLYQVQEIYDAKTGQKFLAQIGDWKLIDQNGYTYVMNYFQFMQRFTPADSLAFQMFIRKDQVRASRGKIFDKMKEELITLYNSVGD